jgi:hypothetical protein
VTFGRRRVLADRGQATDADAAGDEELLGGAHHRRAAAAAAREAAAGAHPRAAARRELEVVPGRAAVAVVGPGVVGRGRRGPSGGGRRGAEDVVHGARRRAEEEVVLPRLVVRVALHHSRASGARKANGRSGGSHQSRRERERQRERQQVGRRVRGFEGKGMGERKPSRRRRGRGGE